MKRVFGRIDQIRFAGIAVAIAMLGTAGCNSSNGGGGGDTTAPPATTLSINFGIKQLQFSWVASSGATHYRLMQNPDGASGFTQVGGNISGTSTTIDIAVHRHSWAGALYFIEACNSAGCSSPSNQVSTLGQMLQAIGYIKASNTGAGDQFGFSVALSGDGNTLAVGAHFEDGDGSDPADDSLSNAGAVYVFARAGGTWVQQAYLKTFLPDAPSAGARFGISVSLSGNGNMLVVGADGAAASDGAAYVFTRTGSSWTSHTVLKGSNTPSAGDHFGISVAVSRDASTIAVGANQEDSDATGVGGDETDNDAVNSGAVYIFTNSGGWSQQAYIKASNTGTQDRFGYTVALSSDGNTLAVGAHLEDSASGGQVDDCGAGSANCASDSGAVYAFVRDNLGAWSQQGYIKAANVGAPGGDEFGYSLSLSNDGNTLAVGALREDGASTGVGGADNDSAPNAGAAYVFTRSAGIWDQGLYIKASNTAGSSNHPATPGEEFGAAVSLSGDGNTLVVGAPEERSAHSGVGSDPGDQLQNSTRRGATYVFLRSGASWSQQAYVKASNSGQGDNFGRSVATNDDGNSVAVGAALEDSAATGVGGDQTTNDPSTVFDAGAVYLY